MIYRMCKRCFALMIVVWSGSPGEEKGSVPTVKIDPQIEERHSKLSELVDGDIEIIPLETTPDCLIGTFSYLAHFDSSHVIYKSEKEVLFFNRKGKYLSKISAYGKGPQEYNNILDILVDAPNKLVYVVERKAERFMVMTGVM